MLTLPEIFIYFPFLLLFLVAIYGLGHLAIAICKIRFQEPTTDLFAKLLTGIYLSITFFSIFKSSGITFNLIFVVLFAASYWHLSQKSPSSKNKKITYLPDFNHLKAYRFWIYLLVFFLIFLARVIFIYDANTGFLYTEVESLDVGYYGQISDFLNLTGQENRYRVLNLWYPEVHGITPYHYFELWFTALLCAIFPTGTMYVFMVFSYSLLLFILFLSYETLLISISKKYKWYYTIVSFLFLFSSIIYLNIFLDVTTPLTSTFHFVHGDHSIPFFIIKQLITELLFITFLVLLIYKEHQLAFYYLLSFSAVTFLLSPLAFGAVFCIILINYKYQLFKIQHTWLFLVMIFSALIIISLWKLNSPTLTSFNEQSAITSLFTFRENSINEFLISSIKALSHMPVIYMPFSLILIFILIVFRKKWHYVAMFRIVLPFSLLILGGWLLSRLSIAPDWGQFFTAVAYPTAKIGFTIVVFGLVQRWAYLKLKYYIPIMLCFGLLFFRVVRNGQLKIRHDVTKVPYSKMYLSEIDSCIQQTNKQGPYIGGVLADSAHLSNISDRSHFLNYFEGKYLGYMRPHNQTITLGTYWVFENLSLNLNSIKKPAIQLTPMVIFVKHQKQNNTFRSADQSVLDFIQTHKLDYIVVLPDANIPDKLQKNITHIIKDVNTGEQFCILKQ